LTFQGVSLTRTDSPVSLTIHDIEKSSLECAENNIVVYYTAKTGDSLQMSYIFTSGAAIIGSGNEVLVAGGEDQSKGKSKPCSLFDCYKFLRISFSQMHCHHCSFPIMSFSQPIQYQMHFSRARLGLKIQV